MSDPEIELKDSDGLWSPTSPHIVIERRLPSGDVLYVLYILIRHGQDLEESMVRAVNDSKDQDRIAAIVGAAVGALYGKKAIPARWIEKLSARTTDCDDGKAFAILATAREVWDKA